MRPSTVVIVLSIASNLALFALLAQRSTGSGTNLPDDSHASALRPPTAKGSNSSLQQSDTSASANHPTLWERLETKDLAELTKRLREAGFGRDEIAMIATHIAYDGFPNYDNQRLTTEMRNLPYWKSDQKLYAVAQKSNEEASKYFEQKHAELVSLLGPFFYLSEDEQKATRERKYGKLSGEKLDALAQLDLDYDQIRVKRLGNGGDANALKSEGTAIEKAFREDLKAILSPEELFEYDLRNSRSAYALRQDSKLFRPSEEEFRALYSLYEARNTSGLTPADFEARAKQALGEERYLEFVQAQDQQSERLNRIVMRLNLPLSVAHSVVQSRRDALAAADAIHADASLSPAIKKMRLNEVVVRTEKAMTDALGTRGFQVYQQHEGDWLKRLK